MSQKKAWWKSNFVLITCSLLISLPAMEIFLRYTINIQTYSDIVNLKGRKYIADYSSYLPFTLPKNVTYHHKTSEFDVKYAINNLGYRGKFPQSIQKPPNTKRLLMLGDSFTLGWGNNLEDTFVQQIQDSLNSEGYAVINAAYHAGYSPDSYYAYLVKEGLALRPDMILVILYSGNDQTDMMSNLWKETDEREMPTTIITTRRYMNYKGESIHSPELLNRFLVWNYTIPFLRNSHAFISITQLFNRVFGVSEPHQVFVWENLTEEEAWERFEHSIQSLSALARQNEIKLVYVLIPPDPKRAQDDRRGDKMLSIIDDKLKLPVIDVRPHLPGEAYYKIDSHFNKLGNSITSGIIIEYMTNHNYFAGQSPQKNTGL